MPNNTYLLEERVFMVVEYSASNFRPSVVIEKWPQRFPNRPIPTDPTIRNTFNKFCNTGCVTVEHQKMQYPSRQLSEEKKVQICASVENDVENNMHLKDHAQEAGVCKTTVWNVLKENGYTAYKPQPHQHFLDDDYFNRMTYAEVTSLLIASGQLSLDNICFSDECTVVLYRRPNRQHFQVWARQNPYAVIDCNTQYQAKLNVWAGMYNGNIVGPYFIDGNLNGARFRQLLENRIIPRLYELGMNVRNNIILFTI